MKNIILTTLMVIGLSGCATHQQSNELAGAAIGGVIGNAVGGKGGAVLGAGMGAIIGGQQPVNPSDTVYYQAPPNVVYVPPYYHTRPSIEYRWVYVPYYRSWGWYHPRHGHFHHHRHHRKH